MDGFRRMLWFGRQHSADQIPLSALQLVTRSSVGRARIFALRPTFDCRATVKMLPDQTIYAPSRCLSLPMFPELTEEQAREVVGVIRGGS